MQQRPVWRDDRDILQGYQNFRMSSAMGEPDDAVDFFRCGAFALSSSFLARSFSCFGLTASRSLPGAYPNNVELGGLLA
jgi:hypothetical protein